MADFNVGDRVRLANPLWNKFLEENGSELRNGSVVTITRVSPHGVAYFEDNGSEIYVKSSGGGTEFIGELVTPEPRQLVVGDRIVLTGSYWKSFPVYAEGGGLAEVTRIRSVSPHFVGDFKMVGSEATNYIFKDDYIKENPEFGYRLVDEWDPAPTDNHQDSLTFRTDHGKVISVAWGQGTKDNPKASISVHGQAVALTEAELEVLILTLVKAKEENDRIFKE